jgi:hypothetical protein
VECKNDRPRVWDPGGVLEVILHLIMMHQGLQILTIFWPPCMLCCTGLRTICGLKKAVSMAKRRGSQ